MDQRVPTDSGSPPGARSAGLDLFVGGQLGAWALRTTAPALVRQVVCLDDALIAVAADSGHAVFAGDPHADAFVPAGAALAVGFPLISPCRTSSSTCATNPPAPPFITP